VTPPVPVPTLDELARDPAQAATLPLEATRPLLARSVRSRTGVLWSARLLEAAPNGPAPR
jgi:hypothetical protein